MREGWISSILCMLGCHRNLKDQQTEFIQGLMTFATML